MNSPREADLTNAGNVFAVANTPLFLLRKLRFDPVVQELSRRFTGQELLQALRASVIENPSDLAEAVRPYVYLTALSLMPSDEALRETSSICAPFYDWLEYIRDYLIETYSSVQTTEIIVPNQVQSSSASGHCGYPAEGIQIIISTN
jgi:hypothetical protein